MLYMRHGSSCLHFFDMGMLANAALIPLFQRRERDIHCLRNVYPHTYIALLFFIINWEENN